MKFLTVKSDPYKFSRITACLLVFRDKDYYFKEGNHYQNQDEKYTR